MLEAKTSHPYYPRSLELPHYVPNDKAVVEIIWPSIAVVGACVVGVWLYSGSRKHLRGCYFTRMKICWFVVCALIHCVLEGYFSIFHKTLAGRQDLLAQTWKEYSRGDSRYLTSDTFTVCMETMTAFVDGPLALLAAYGFLARSSSRHVAQLWLSLYQLYGDVLYFTTEIKDGFTHGEMWHPIYFWLYFVFMNALWIVIPFACVVEACIALCRGQSKVDAGPVAMTRAALKPNAKKRN